MGIQNSHIEIILGCFRKMYLDLYDTLPPGLTTTSTSRKRLMAERDAEYTLKRVRKEGLEFLTKNLPKLGKTIDQALMSGASSLPHLDGLKPYRKDGFPCFLHEAWKVVDLILRESSALAEQGLHPDEMAYRVLPYSKCIRALRTVLFGAYKLDVPYTSEQAQEKISEFLQIEKELRSSELPSENWVTEHAATVIGSLLSEFNFDKDRLKPRHGPGAVATGERDEEKWKFSNFYASLHQRFPYYEFMYGIRSNGRALNLATRASEYRSMERHEYPVAKLVLVPKDSRGPRIISAEPLEVQYIQQGLSRQLMQYLEGPAFPRLLHVEGYGNMSIQPRINFTDQTVNQRLAVVGSLTGAWSTIDLKDASDRVSLKLVERLIPERMIDDLRATRSHATSYKGVEIPLVKFAPMGSALCFPIESVIFYGLSVGALLARGVPFVTAASNVYVYGDDLVVPTEYAQDVIRALELHDLRVNTSKCCTEGNFRESCGVDAWFSHVVTPTRITKLPGRGPSDGKAAAAWLANASRFYSHGFYRTAAYCRKVVETQLGGRIPITSQDFGFLSMVVPSFMDNLTEFDRVKWDAESCHYTAKVFILQNKRRASSLSGWNRLHRSLLERLEFIDPDEVVVRDATKVTRRRKALLFT